MGKIMMNGIQYGVGGITDASDVKYDDTDVGSALDTLNNGLTTVNEKLYRVGADHRETISVLTYAVNSASSGLSFYSTRSGTEDNPTSTGSFFFFIFKLEAANIGIMTIPFNNNNIYINRRVNGTWTGWKSAALT